MNVITCTGGKGGTGKTFIAVNIAIYLQSMNKKVLLIDSDVENPNTNILLGIPVIEKINEVYSEKVFQFVPDFDESVCTKCGRCSEVCRPHAILQISGSFPILMENLCSSCELCYKICPDKAIKSSKREIGEFYFMDNISAGDKGKLDLLIGVLKIGGVRSVAVIERLFEYAEKLNDKEEYDYIIADTSPGAHCDVEFVLKESDFSVCVTEPTPFGAHDLKRILDLSRILNKKSYVILNRFGMADYNDQISQIVKNYDSELLAKIPLDQKILESYAQGIPFLKYKGIPSNSPSKIALQEMGTAVMKLSDKYKSIGG
ncbi:MAG: nucleotide-binding protein [Promethearchaeota archaeon]